MIKEQNVLVFDIDGTLCDVKKKEESYLEIAPKYDMVAKLRDYREKGFYLILNTARQMRTHQGNVGRINAVTAKTLFEWLDKHEIPYDEIHFGKPWCGKNGFYIDDKTVRPKEFLDLSHEEIIEVLKRDANVK